MDLTRNSLFKPELPRQRLGTLYEAHAGIRSLPGYHPTPVRALYRLAKALGLKSIWVKDESDRFSLGSFKAVGAAAGVSQALVGKIGSQTVACASAGNHGRAVARFARLWGHACVVYVPQSLAPERQRLIEQEDARVVAVPGTFDVVVETLAEAAQEGGWIVVSDTTEDSDDPVALAIMRGYTLIVEELLDALPAQKWPTHLFVQAGVGGLAAACIDRLSSLAHRRPITVVVEPTEADCCFQSSIAGTRVRTLGSMDTRMGRLACGIPSAVAWPILSDGAGFFMRIKDDTLTPAEEALAESTTNIVAGPAGLAGLAALIAASRDRNCREILGLDGSARALVIVSEIAVSPDVPVGGC